MEILVNHVTIPLTDEGFLKNLDDWNEDVAKSLAEQAGLILTDDHFKVFNYLRSLYIEHHHSPAVRALVKGIANTYGTTLGNSLTLQMLFPGGLLRQSHQLAGLPKPPHCVTLFGHSLLFAFKSS
jgi:tRNA 2-thiouridine synthesizing protein E